jgi:membrane associated rhomboid family serine protease
MSGEYPAGNPWFRVGRFEIGTVLVVAITVVASWVLSAVQPASVGALLFAPQLVAQGELWRVFTWPWANSIGLWAVLDVFFLWYFGRELEAQLGRARMAWLLAGIWASLTVASSAIWLVTAGSVGLAGIGFIEFVVLLGWIADNPARRFLFNIPAWVIGAVLLGLQVLALVRDRNFSGLISLLVSLVLVALVAKRVGLLSQFAWIPGGRAPSRPAGRPTPRRPPRASKQVRVALRNQDRAALDRDQLDALLDQISDQGLDSLTPAQRRELMRLRDRLRGA